MKDDGRNDGVLLVGENEVVGHDVIGEKEIVGKDVGASTKNDFPARVDTRVFC
jgi:hypothetical protein